MHSPMAGDGHMRLASELSSAVPLPRLTLHYLSQSARAYINHSKPHYNTSRLRNAALSLLWYNIQSNRFLLMLSPPLSQSIQIAGTRHFFRSWSSTTSGRAIGNALFTKRECSNGKPTRWNSVNATINRFCPFEFLLVLLRRIFIHRFALENTNILITIVFPLILESCP